MEKQLKTILSIIAIVVIALMIFNILWSNRKLEHALQKIDTVQVNLDKALINLNYSKLKIDTMRSELQDYKMFIYEIKGRSEIIDLEKRKNDYRFNSERSNINKKLDSLYNILGIDEIIIPIEPLNNEVK